jgi:hypothetical protein
VGILLRSLGLILLFVVVFHQIDKASFLDAWSKGVEESLLYENFERLYMDGPRPFFVQRSHPKAQIFYDLNPRFKSASDLPRICEIKVCFDPELWVFSDSHKSSETLDALAGEFETILYRKKSFFVAKNPKVACDHSMARCELLLMNK